MNRLQKAITTLTVAFSFAFLDGLFGLGFSDSFYVFLGIVEIIAIFFIWRAAFPKEETTRFQKK